jgi:hypothetical protein
LIEAINKEQHDKDKPEEINNDNFSLDSDRDISIIEVNESMEISMLLEQNNRK